MTFSNEWRYLAREPLNGFGKRHVSDRAPIAKCAPNPARMLGTRQITFELGMLRANIEKLD
ncbi:MAG: hypothetical protein ACXW2U_09710 [Telluria sp.]